MHIYTKKKRYMVLKGKERRQKKRKNLSFPEVEARNV